MCVCIYIYIHTCMYALTELICFMKQIQEHAYTESGIHVYTYTKIYIHIQADSPKHFMHQTHVYIHTYTHTYIYRWTTLCNSCIRHLQSRSCRVERLKSTMSESHMYVCMYECLHGCVSEYIVVY